MALLGLRLHRKLKKLAASPEAPSTQTMAPGSQPSQKREIAISIASLDHILDNPTDKTSCHAAVLSIFANLPLNKQVSWSYLKRKIT